MAISQAGLVRSVLRFAAERQRFRIVVMKDSLMHLAQSIAASALQDVVVGWLRNVPGLPPIVQTVHILSVACVMASIVMIDLRLLGLAVPSQSPEEMARRLMPWLWTALSLLLLSGAMFVIARPHRYFLNPVFGIKLALLMVAIACSTMVRRLIQSGSHSVLLKAAASLSLLAWLGVVLAGRWIAYSDYLFMPE